MSGSAKYYAAHTEEVKRRSKEWAAKNPERAKQLNRESWHRRYHSTPRPGRQPKRATTPCLRCGAAVSVPPCERRKGAGKYCSAKCYRAALQRQPNRECVTCGRRFAATKSQIDAGHGKYCSMKCRPPRDLEKRRRTRHRESIKRRARVAGAVVGKIDFAKIERRDQMRCHICHRKVNRSDLHFDHVIPLSKGGPHCEANLAVSHKRCNLQKNAKVTTLF